MSPSIYKHLLIPLLFMAACGPSSTEEAPAEQAFTDTEVVDTPEAGGTDTMGLKSRAEVLAVTGYIDVPPQNKAAVSPYYAGYVKDIRVLPGQSVKKGEVLFRLENPEYLEVQQEYLEAREQIDYLKADYERQQALSDERIASVKQRMKAESDYRVMRARLLSLEEQLRLMGLSIEALEAGDFSNTLVIRAPIAGNITAVNLLQSAYVDPREVAIEIVNTDHLHLELDVFEKDALKVREGQTIRFQIPEASQQRYEGEVYLIGKQLDPMKRSIRVHGHINEAGDLFIPGMFVDAEIVLEGESISGR